MKDVKKFRLDKAKEEYTSSEVVRKNRIKQRLKGLRWVAAIIVMIAALWCSMIIVSHTENIRLAIVSVLPDTNSYITIPADIVFSNEREKDYIEEFKQAHGLASIVVNDDKSVTYGIPRGDRKNLVDYYENQVEDCRKAIIKNSSNNITDVKINKNYDIIRVYLSNMEELQDIDNLYASLIDAEVKKYLLFKGSTRVVKTEIYTAGTDDFCTNLADWEGSEKISNYSVEIVKDTTTSDKDDYSVEVE